MQHSPPSYLDRTGQVTRGWVCFRIPSPDLLASASKKVPPQIVLDDLIVKCLRECAVGVQEVFFRVPDYLVLRITCDKCYRLEPSTAFPMSENLVNFKFRSPFGVWDMVRLLLYRLHNTSRLLLGQ